MSDLWLGEVGIRVTDLARSLKFYTEVLGLEEIQRAGDEDSTYVLLRDRHSGQRLELNWCAESSPFAAPYTLGEALDHFEVRVMSVPEVLERLRALGMQPATRKLWANRRVVEELRKDPKMAELMEKELWTSKSGHRIVHIQDPDGIFLCLYDHPEEPWGGPIPDHY